MHPEVFCESTYAIELRILFVAFIHCNYFYCDCVLMHANVLLRVMACLPGYWISQLCSTFNSRFGSYSTYAVLIPPDIAERTGLSYAFQFSVEEA